MRWCCTIGVGLLLILVGCNTRKHQAKQEMERGTAAYKAAQYEKAIEHFRRALELDPTLINVRLYLLQMNAGGNRSSDIASLEEVLKHDSSNLGATLGLAYVHSGLRHYDEAKRYYLRATVLDPNNPEYFYSAAVINWNQSYQLRMTTRAQLKLKPDDKLITHKECYAVREQNWSRIQEGVTLLQKALQLSPAYDDAMAYMSLMYRERADLQCGNKVAYEADKTLAEKWLDCTLEFKRAKSLTGRPLISNGAKASAR